MFQIAVYGKGGIGKSTLSANISYSLSLKNKKVMQIGCDPKHDSTRLLLGGRAQTTVLDYVRETPVLRRKLEDVIETGSGGVLCAESGGPEPGIGCAGRGILTTFDTLKKLGADSYDTDIRVYDVLGDVVCGGFAVPLREEYADAVILVTSGEFMSMYAANNIMKGLSNFDTGKPRLLGLILNSRGVENEEESVKRFADAAGVPVIAAIPRDSSFRAAEAAGKTVRELFPDSELSVAIDSVADLIIKTSEGKQPLYDPRPLDDDQMTDLAAGRPVRPGSPEKIRDPCSGCGRRRSIKGTRIMDSCAAFGAMAAFMKLTDWTVLLHGPESCMYLMEMSRGGMSRSLYPESAGGTAAALRVCCTMMDDSASIFGGTGKLKEKLEELCGEGCGKIAVVTTCMPGIIGDHSADAIEHIRKKYPGAELALIEADGDIAGDYTDGFRMAVREITGMIDPSVRPERRYVNLVGISFFDLQSPGCMAELAGILSVFGLKINCRFLDDCPSGDIRMFCRAETDILLSGSPSDLSIMSMISERTGRKPFPRPLPIGMKDYGKWLEAMGKFAGMEEEAAREWKNAEEKYDRYVKNNRKVFEGKKIIIIDRLKRSCVWAAELLADLGAEIVRIGCFSRCGEPGMTCPERFGGVTVENYSPKMLEDDLESLDPDLLICDLLFRTGKKCRTARIGRSGVGPGGVLRFADYVGNVLRLPATEGWKEDGE